MRLRAISLKNPTHRAFQIVALGGETPQNSVTRRTDYLVVGLQDYRKTKGNISSKMQRALTLREKGQEINILCEYEFAGMIDDEQIILDGFSVHGFVIENITA